MKVGTLLLDQNDNYLVDGHLPERPPYDKAFLKALATGQALTTKGLELLPLSIVTTAYQQGDKGLLTGIREISEEAHLLIVTRSSERGIGKKFDFKNFIRRIKMYDIELWVRHYD